MTLDDFPPSHIKVRICSLASIRSPLMPGSKLTFAQNILVGPCIFFGKLAILLLYLKIFQVNRTRYLIYAGTVACFLAYMPYVPLSAYFCSPHTGQPWSLVVELRCSKLELWAVIQGTLAVAIDVYIFILPIPVVLGLQMSRRRKFAMLAVFGFALLYVMIVPLQS